jgi:CheY-like chemotaxis protein
MISEKRILVVEDDAITSDALKMVLELEGYQVDCAANGQEALKHLQQTVEKPDLILLDLFMPVMDGKQFREEQKSHPAFSHIPVVVLSGADRETTMDASGYIVKPFQPDELLKAVRHHA